MRVLLWKNQKLMNEKWEKSGEFEILPGWKIPICKEVPTDEIINIGSSKVTPDGPIVPSEIRVCAGTCGSDVWLTESMIKALGQSEYRVFCAECLLKELRNQNAAR